MITGYLIFIIKPPMVKKIVDISSVPSNYTAKKPSAYSDAGTG
jgi:hypothetical protein